MDSVLHSITAAVRSLSPTEMSADAAAFGSVILCNFRRIENYPVGIASTLLFFFVFWSARLYSSALLQVWLTAVQAYGWWFWLKGSRGGEPRITRVPASWWMVSAILAGAGALALSTLTRHFGASMALADSALFTMSVVAQFFLDRKKLENWAVWLAINTVSVPLYWSQGLYFTAILYVAFWCNAFWGFALWFKEYAGYARPAAESAPVCPETT